jgi:hypothetical protein
MSFFLRELIPLELSTRYPDKWRVDKSGENKDIVYIPDDQYSIELKTSSNPTRIFGNRSYACRAFDTMPVTLLSFVSKPNARFQPPLEAEATEERTRSAVACKPLILIEAPSQQTTVVC